MVSSSPSRRGRQPCCLDGSPLSPASDRVCKHMNEDHAGSCLAYAWFLAGISSATKARLTAVNKGGFDLLCATPAQDAEGNPIEIAVRVPFQPPLKSDEELRPRMVALHHQTLAPRLRHLLPPLASLPLAAMGILGATLANPTLRFTAPVNQLGMMLLGSRTNMQALFTAAVAIHAVEASLAARFASKLKLSVVACIGWFCLTVAGGNGTLSIVQELNAAQREGAGAKTAPDLKKQE